VSEAGREWVKARETEEIRFLLLLFGGLRGPSKARMPLPALAARGCGKGMGAWPFIGNAPLEALRKSEECLC